MEELKMAELTKKAIIEAMNEAYKKNGYYGACKVYEEMRLPYPADQTKELVKKVENTFVGTIAEIKAKVEETKAEAKKARTAALRKFESDSKEICDTLIHLAAIDSLPNEVATNKEFIDTISNYVLDDYEYSNWPSYFAEYWNIFERAEEALKSK